jgi:hypothetical protein
MVVHAPSLCPYASALCGMSQPVQPTSTATAVAVAAGSTTVSDTTAHELSLITVHSNFANRQHQQHASSSALHVLTSGAAHTA